jgi:hypothetical protein
MSSPVFVFVDEVTHQKYSIELLSPPPGITFEEIIKYNDFFDDIIIPQIEKHDLETRFGVHYFSAQFQHEIIGFTTYEVEEDKWDELMNIWLTILHEVGFKTGGEICQNN